MENLKGIKFLKAYKEIGRVRIKLEKALSEARDDIKKILNANDTGVIFDDQFGIGYLDDQFGIGYLDDEIRRIRSKLMEYAQNSITNEILEDLE